MEASNSEFSRKTSGLVRHLSILDIVLMVICTPAASGIIFFSVSEAGAYPGGSPWLAFLIGMALFLPICYVVAIGSSAAPRPGSMYVFVCRSLNPRIAFVASMMMFIGYALTIGVLGVIATKLISALIQSAGMANQNEAILTITRFVANKHILFCLSLIWVFFFWIITTYGFKSFKYIVRTIYLIPIIATIITFIIFVSTSTDNFFSSFDSTWGEGISDKIINVAQANKCIFSGFSWSNTFGLLLVVLWAYGGVEMAGYASGEVRSARKSMFWGYIFGWLLLGSLYVVFSAGVFNTLGSKLPVAYSYLYNTEEYKPLLDQMFNGNAPAPSIPFYLTSIIGNNVISTVLSLSLILWFVNTMPGFFLGISRLLFALGLDGQLPSIFTKYNARSNSPTYASHLTAIVATIGCFLYAYEALSVVATISFLIYFFIWIYGLAAMCYAYKYHCNPSVDPFESPMGNIKIMGTPLIALVGLIVFVEGWYFIFLTLSEVSWPTSGWLLGFMFIIGLIILLKHKDYDEEALYISLPLDAQEGYSSNE